MLSISQGKGIRFVAVALLLILILPSGSSAQLDPNGRSGDGRVSVVYDALTGSIGVEPKVIGGVPIEFTAFRLQSNQGIFLTPIDGVFTGDFDFFKTDRLFKAVFGESFGALTFGHAKSGLSRSFLEMDLTPNGTPVGGGFIDGADLIYIGIPGDSNYDGKFNTSDIVAVLQANKFQVDGRGEAADWSEGDWNGDGVFSRKDFIAALQAAQYLAQE